jgi:hypothetical protein
MGTGNSLSACVAVCAKDNYNFVGTQASNWCLCGNKFGKYGFATNCNLACSGSSAEICGGAWANTIYSIAPITDGGLKNLGCFKDSTTRVMTAYVA